MHAARLGVSLSTLSIPFHLSSLPIR
jgi:hypothetical protein